MRTLPKNRTVSRPGDASPGTGWQAVAGWQVIALGAFAVLILFFGNTGERWFPLLDSANLVFHEAGHPILGLFSHRLGVYGGTLGQLVFPLVVAASFLRRRDAVSTSFSLLWLCQNFFNIARYMADARVQLLPLVGGGDHDWTEIFSRWHLLHLDTGIAALIRCLGFCGVLAACLALAWLCWQQHRAPGSPAPRQRPGIR